MDKPVRLQRKRTKGFRLQELSLKTNGLPVIVVSRGTKWGNPFKIGDKKYLKQYYRRWLEGRRAHFLPEIREWILDNLHLLQGKNLACWCPIRDKNGLYVPCHADILLELANKKEQNENKI